MVGGGSVDPGLCLAHDRHDCGHEPLQDFAVLVAGAVLGLQHPRPAPPLPDHRPQQALRVQPSLRPVLQGARAQGAGDGHARVQQEHVQARTRQAAVRPQTILEPMIINLCGLTFYCKFMN